MVWRKKRQYRNFIRDESGNIAFMAGGAILPMLALVLGGIEMAEVSRVKRSMQHAADTAVMAAFDGNDLRWPQRIKRADRFFDFNFQNEHRVEKLQRKLRGQRQRRKVVLEYTASAQNVNLTGKLNPFADTRITVKAKAVYFLGSSRPPKLVYAGN